MADEIEEARKRHNIYAPQLAAMIIAAGHGRSDDTMVILESVIVGVIGHYFRDNPKLASETLDLMTEGAMRRL